MTTKKAPSAGPPSLADVAATLEESYGKAPPPPSSDPFALVLWEQCAYLADDDVRGAAFATLGKKTKGYDAKRVLALSPEELVAIAKSGGPIAAEDRAERMRAAAQLVMDEHDGDLATSLAEKTPVERRKALKKFAQIALPGADKILGFSKLERALGLESNGLRVVVRLGYVRENKSYDKMWKAARDALEPQLPSSVDDVVTVHRLLRRHGLTVCTRTKPKCPACPLRPVCAFGKRQK